MGETMKVDHLDLPGLLRIRDILKGQMDELDEDISAINEELQKRIKAAGTVINEKGSRRIVHWREDGKVQELDRRFTDSLSLTKDAEEILLQHDFWDIYKEKAVDPSKVKAILDSEECPEGLADQIVKSRGSFSLNVGKPKDPSAQQILDKQQEDKLQEEASEVF